MNINPEWEKVCEQWFKNHRLLDKHGEDIDPVDSVKDFIKINVIPEFNPDDWIYVNEKGEKV